MSEYLTPAQKRLVDLVASNPPMTIHEAAAKLSTTVAGVSNTRSCLLMSGVIAPWKLWQGPIELTEEGKRLALTDS